jgi:uncharacterized RDD family membrane protein YckC
MPLPMTCGGMIAMPPRAGDRTRRSDRRLRLREQRTTKPPGTCFPSRHVPSFAKPQAAIRAQTSHGSSAVSYDSPDPAGGLMSDEWYYSWSGTDHEGPATLDELRRLVKEGRLAPSHMVWREGMPNWVAAGGVQQLFPSEAPPMMAEAVGPVEYQTPAAQINYYNPSGAVVMFAGFWLRFVAFVIDSIVLWVPEHAVSSLLQETVRLPIPMSHGIPLIPTPSSMSALMTNAIDWLYFALMESSSYQATLGKMACGLIVTDSTGARISFGRASGRYFAKMISAMILYIGYMMAGWTERKQALHDMIAGTIVIRKNLPLGR